MRHPLFSPIAPLISICLSFCIPIVNGQFCSGSKLQKTFAVTLAGRRETVRCCQDDVKPAYCFSRPLKNVHLNQTCKCVILTTNSISSRRPKIKFCKWREKVQMIVRKDAAYLRDTEKYEDAVLPEYHHYPCEMARDQWRCPDEFREEVEDKDMDCSPSRHGFPASTIDTNNLYKCSPEDDFDWHTVSTCARPLCEKRYRHKKGDKACLPPRRFHPEYLGYIWETIRPSMYCTDAETNSKRRRGKCRLLPICAPGYTEQNPKLEKNHLPPPLHYMPMGIESTVGMDIINHCQKLCPPDLNIPGADCQILPTCDEEKRVKKDRVWVKRCLLECTAERKTKCNRRPWCLYKNGTWIMPDKIHDVFDAGKCEIRTCERYETEFTDNCTRKAKEQTKSHGESTPTLVKAGTGLFIAAMLMVYFGIVFHPVTDEDLIDDDTSLNPPLVHIRPSMEDLHQNLHQERSNSIMAPVAHALHSTPKSLVSQTPTEGSGKIGTPRTPSFDTKRSETKD